MQKTASACGCKPKLRFDSRTQCLQVQTNALHSMVHSGVLLYANMSSSTTLASSSPENLSISSARTKLRLSDILPATFRALTNSTGWVVELRLGCRYHNELVNRLTFKLIPHILKNRLRIHNKDPKLINFRRKKATKFSLSRKGWT